MAATRSNGWSLPTPLLSTEDETPNTAMKRKHEHVLMAIKDRTDEFVVPVGMPTKRKKEKDETSSSSSSSGNHRNSRRSKAVLDEETYVDALSYIIERDYFPELAKLKRHLRLLEAYDSGDAATIRVLHDQILTEQRQDSSSSRATPGPVGGGHHRMGGGVTAMEEGLEDESQGMRETVEGMSVDQFMQTFTSEDNASFEVLHQKDREEWRKARHWAFECIENGTDGAKRPGMLMLYHLGGKVMTAEERRTFDSLLSSEPKVGDSRPSQPDTWRFRVRNQFMFPPELADSEEVCRIGGSADQRTLLALPPPPAPSSSSALVSSTQSHGNRLVGPGMRPPKIIQRSNTSFRAAVVSSSSDRTPQESPLELPHTPSVLSECRSVASSDSLATTVKGDMVGVKKYRTVAMTPSPMPGVADPSPMMTWGVVGGTPQILDTREVMRSLPMPWAQPGHGGLGAGLSGGLGDKFSYEPPAAQQRDLIAHSLGSKGGFASGGHATAGRGTGSGTSSSSSRRHSAPTASSSRHPSKPKLTPAAMSLAHQLSSRRSTGAGNATPFGGSATLSNSYRRPASSGRRSSSSSIPQPASAHHPVGSDKRVNTDDLLCNF